MPWIACPTCGGSGVYWNIPCSGCYGKKRIYVRGEIGPNSSAFGETDGETVARFTALFASIAIFIMTL